MEGQAAANLRVTQSAAAAKIAAVVVWRLPCGRGAQASMRVRLAAIMGPPRIAMAAHPSAQFKRRQNTIRCAEIAIERVDIDDDPFGIKPAAEGRQVDVVSGVADAHAGVETSADLAREVFEIAAEVLQR